MGRILAGNGSSLRESYTYDRLGNRLTKSVDGVLTSHYTYNSLQQLVSVAEGEVTRHFTHDKRGNMIAESLGEVPQYSYTYDSEGRMVRGRNEITGEERRYAYNALGMRMALEKDLRMDGISPEYSFYRLERIDELGSITHVEQAGEVLNRYDYDAWGNLITCEEQVENRFTFTGQQLDPH